ncbi:MAG: hypothetical protein ACLPLP_21300 [Mycobacterium sp.]
MAESTEKKTMAERAENLSDEVLQRVEARQRAAIEAMRKFVDRLDEALPDLGEERRKNVLDALVDFAEKVGATTNDFMARMVRSASGTLKEGTAKPAAEAEAKAAAKGTAKKAAAKHTAKPAAD